MDSLIADPVVSVVIPAFNEADYLPIHLPTIQKALLAWQVESGGFGEIIVVDNASTDTTAHVARELGARVVHEPIPNIAAARNTGAATAAGEYLFFIDADVTVPEDAIAAAMRCLTNGSLGGAIPPVYHCKKLSSRLLCRYWDWHRARSGGAQGVAQFCTTETFNELGGYRADLFMSEDVEFFARLRVLADRSEQTIAVLEDVRVEPSTRRYDAWPTWRMFWWQNPITARLRLRSRRFWRHWYNAESTVR